MINNELNPIRDLIDAIDHAMPIIRDLMTSLATDPNEPASTERDRLILACDMLADDLHDDPDYHSPLTIDRLDSIRNFLDPDYDLLND
jgi:hypothetical protein